MLLMLLKLYSFVLLIMTKKLLLSLRVDSCQVIVIDADLFDVNLV